ncbi:MAG: type-F conjugative transfer system secretin TraK [Pseudomonadota bacterium]|jgi:type-F conjugative transfer system secretin TraK
MHKRITFVVALFSFIATLEASASQSLPMHPDKRIKATISNDSMNRIAVANDRITQVFGDEQAYESQTEESTGQVFLKPTQENGNKALAITLITESGATQDMTLEPSTRDAATIILKNSVAASPSQHGGGSPGQVGTMMPTTYGMGQGMGQHHGYSPQSFQEQVIQAMKLLVSGQAPTIEVEDFTRTGPKGVELGLMAAYMIGFLKGYKIEIKNTSGAPLELLEKDFYRTGDVAIFFDKRFVGTGEAATFYVVGY